MKTRSVTRLCAAGFLLSLASSNLTAQTEKPRGPEPKLLRVGNAIKGKYIVVLKSNVSDTDLISMADEAVSLHGAIRVKHRYLYALRGFSVEMSDTVAQSLSQDPRVEFIEEDGVVHGDAHTAQTGAVWGLDRIDQRNLPLDNVYSYNGSGFGVNAYVIDSGIRQTHQDLAGRVVTVRDWVGDGQNGNDCNGHGTNVTSILGGGTFGVAKQARLHSLRVLNCTNNGSNSNVIAAVDWVRNNFLRPAVTNMSLGSAASSAVDSAVQNLINAGVPVVVAAGNTNVNASTRSPARVASAITVSATNNADTRAFTCAGGGPNFGSVVDVFAPGDCITGAGIASDTATAQLTGTSQAAPHVAGMVARYLESDPEATTLAVSSVITRSATSGAVVNPGTGSPNLLLYTVQPTASDSARYGDFNGDGQMDVLVQSAWGIGILTYNSGSLSSLMVAPNGSWFGDWLYSSQVNHVVDIANFDGDPQGRDDLLITSPWGIGILTFNGSGLTSLMAHPNGTFFGGWNFQSGIDRITGHGDFNGNGRQDVLLTSPWGIGILEFSSELERFNALMLAPNGTAFGSWSFDSNLNRVGIFGDFDGNGSDDVLVRSAWGIGILKLSGSTLTSILAKANGTKFGSWTYNSKTDRIAGIGNFRGGTGAKEILITESSGMAVLYWDGSTLKSVAKVSNGTKIGNWVLDPKNNFIGRIGDVHYYQEGGAKDDVIVRSSWGIGILTLDTSQKWAASYTAPNATRFGNWLYNQPGDRILGVGRFSLDIFKQSILVTSPWGIGVLYVAPGGSLSSLMLAPNGTFFGGWNFQSSLDRVGVRGDIQ